MPARGSRKRPWVNSITTRPAIVGSGGKVAARTGNPPWAELLVGLHRRVRRAVSGCGRGGAGGTNAKGDDVKLFDLAANGAAVAVLRKFAAPLIVDSEEAERLRIGTDPPRHRLVLDPVDGSDNRARGLPLSAVSCAVIAIDAPLHPDWVEAALVGPLEEEMPLIALKGSGAWRGRERLATSGVRRLAEAMVSVELNHLCPPPGLARLMAGARGVRAYGCASRALALVAAGATDAHVDVRGRLTAESYLAAARLVIEAGGWVGGPDGSPLPAASGLTDRVGLIAAASRELYEEITERLADDGD